jgi:hypothetical protein
MDDLWLTVTSSEGAYYVTRDGRYVWERIGYKVTEYDRLWRIYGGVFQVDGYSDGFPDDHGHTWVTISNRDTDGWTLVQTVLTELALEQILECVSETS